MRDPATVAARLNAVLMHLTTEAERAVKPRPARADPMSKSTFCSSPVASVSVSPGTIVAHVRRKTLLKRHLA